MTTRKRTAAPRTLAAAIEQHTAKCPTPARVPLEQTLAEQRAAQFTEAIKAYACPCGYWHIGKVDRALQRKLDAAGGASC